ncbi:MAG: YrbL family protein [Pseudomonadota bacterium]
MIDYTQLPVAGRGDERICYLHPFKPGRCLKISQLDKKKQTMREINYFRYLKKKGASFELIPDFYGVVESNDFIGLEQELILDNDGHFAPNLYYYLSSDLSDLQKERLLSALHKYKKYLIDNNIVVCDLVLSNFLVVECEKQTKIYLIDGFGASEFFPVANYLKFIGRMKIHRKWKRFLNDRFMPVYNLKQNSHIGCMGSE